MARGFRRARARRGAARGGVVAQGAPRGGSAHDRRFSAACAPPDDAVARREPAPRRRASVPRSAPLGEATAARNTRAARGRVEEAATEAALRRRRRLLEHAGTWRRRARRTPSATATGRGGAARSGRAIARRARPTASLRMRNGTPRRRRAPRAAPSRAAPRAPLRRSASRGDHAALASKGARQQSSLSAAADEADVDALLRRREGDGRLESSREAARLRADDASKRLNRGRAVDAARSRAAADAAPCARARACVRRRSRAAPPSRASGDKMLSARAPARVRRRGASPSADAAQRHACAGKRRRRGSMAAARALVPRACRLAREVVRRATHCATRASRTRPAPRAEPSGPLPDARCRPRGAGAGRTAASWDHRRQPRQAQRRARPSIASAKRDTRTPPGRRRPPCGPPGVAALPRAPERAGGGATQSAQVIMDMQAWQLRPRRVGGLAERSRPSMIALDARLLRRALQALLIVNAQDPREGLRHHSPGHGPRHARTSQGARLHRRERAVRRANSSRTSTSPTSRDFLGDARGACSRRRGSTRRQRAVDGDQRSPSTPRRARRARAPFLPAPRPRRQLAPSDAACAVRCRAIAGGGRRRGASCRPIDG